jgi:hypothetical protein
VILTVRLLLWACVSYADVFIQPGYPEARLGRTRLGLLRIPYGRLPTIFQSTLARADGLASVSNVMQRRQVRQHGSKMSVAVPSLQNHHPSPRLLGQRPQLLPGYRLGPRRQLSSNRHVGKNEMLSLLSGLSRLHPLSLLNPTPRPRYRNCLPFQNRKHAPTL